MTPAVPATAAATHAERIVYGAAAVLNPQAVPREALTAIERPKPLQSITASAQRLTKKNFAGSSFKKSTDADWQEDGWDMYDLVGEQRFLATTLAGRMSQARLFVGKLSDDPNTEPEPVEDVRLNDALNRIGGGASGRAQLINRMGVNLFVAGDVWLVGVPKRLVPGTEEEQDEREDVADQRDELGRRRTSTTDARMRAALGADDPTVIVNADGTVTNIDPLAGDLDEDTMDDLQWFALSVSEIATTAGDQVSLSLPGPKEVKVEVDPDEVYLLRLWRSHPRRSWQADSPTRSSLPVLRELVGLTMHISAQVDSRLAGAGLLVVPQSAVAAMKRQLGLPEDSQEDPFTDALMEAMLKPISDRSNASALVPLVVTVPDESTGLFQHITFDKPLDQEARSMRDEAIRRLALGQDAPPELLLGTGGMNHWGAWLVREDVVTTHLEPPLALICDALTTQYLRPVMREMGYNDAQIEQHVIWYDVSHMIMRPNRATDAERLYDKGVLSDDALREATGFDETDAPETNKMGAAQLAVFEMIKARPELVSDPGIPMLLEQVQGLIDGNPVQPPEPEPVPEGLQEDGDEDDSDEDTDADDNTEDEDSGASQAGPPATAEDDAPALSAQRVQLNALSTRSRGMVPAATPAPAPTPTEDADA